MNITVLTIFPEMFGPVTTQSMLGRANDAGILRVEVKNIRDYTLDKHGRTDDTPFGGGAGMVFTPEPVFRALEDLHIPAGASQTGTFEKTGKGSQASARPRCIYLSPRGRMLDRPLIEELSHEKELVLLCGHYEGVDQRILDAYDMEEVSVGDYILTGGELPAMILIDAVARFLPDVLGNRESNSEESIYSGLLEYPQYTKPRVYRAMEVPGVLVSGDHEKIALWQFEQSLRLTRKRRPDLFEAYCEKHREALTARKLPGTESLSKKQVQVLKQVLAEGTDHEQ